VRRGQGTFVSTDGTGQTGRERRQLAGMVAERALREAYRNGLSAAELMEAIRVAETTSSEPGQEGAGQ
jgi:DNA-binding transcriptional regulator YhcF (GntR family)